MARSFVNPFSHVNNDTGFGTNANYAKAKAYLAFSDHAVIAPYRGGQGLMFRLAPYKEHHTLTDVDIRVNAALKIVAEGRGEYRFFDLVLERSRVDNLPMNWTVVHPMDENSPLHGLSAEDMKAADLEIYVLVRGFDDVYSTYVHQRTSYTHAEVRVGRKFAPMYHESDDGRTTILELDKLNDHIAAAG